MANTKKYTAEERLARLDSYQKEYREAHRANMVEYQKAYRAAKRLKAGITEPVRAYTKKSEKGESDAK